MKKIFLFLLTFATILQSRAEGFPTISTDDNEVWYLIQFMNGGNAITAKSNNAQITTSAAIADESQQWKILGNDTDGYTFTNKKGYTLYVPSAAKNQMVSASSSPTGVTKFIIKTTANSSYSGGFEIHPKGNTNISMNLWGGPNENRGVGLWDKNDPNNPVTFTNAAQLEAQTKYTLIPYPAHLEETAEGTLNITSLKEITYTSEDVQKIVTEFATQLALTSAHSLQIKESGSEAAEGQIWLAIDEEISPEGYTLNIKEDRVEIKASEKAGFLYAIQTLKQLLPYEFYGTAQASNAEWVLPLLSIKDQPNLGHRGFMLDIARHFFNKEEVKRVLDIMTVYKMNRFHWHLTDDQGWRIEIPEYPKLTEVGAIRSGSFTSPGEGAKFFDDTEYGRGLWYSQDDLREIVAYAKERNIEIIPEIDLPGHMVAAIAAYPEFSCDPNKEYSVRIDGGISHDVLNIGDDKVIDFLKCVLDNVSNIFPYPVIHIGGDECPTEQWAVNDLCLKRVKELGLSGVNQLQSWLVEELGIYLKEKHGKDIVVWDELLANWNSTNTVKPIIMAWNSIDKSREAANKGFKSIIVPYQTLYIDFMQAATEDRFIDEPYYGGWGDGWVNTVEEVYTFNPLSSLSGKEEYCIGVQGNLWTETCNDIIELEYQLLPRMLALAETGWLPSSKKSWSSFYRRLQSHDEVLDILGYTYAKHYIEPAEKSNYELAIEEASNIISASKRGGAGYPAADIHDALQTALNAATADEENLSALETAIETYKNAEIIQPEIGKTYQIVSASTYYKKQYAGSTMYVNGNNVRFHYTPQTEPEELWQFEAAENGYIIKNLNDETMSLSMPTYNAAVTMSEQGTPIRIDKATIATSNYTYIPGVVTISAVSGYKPNATGNIKRLNAEVSGLIYAKNEPALCYPGTWYIVEVTDFLAQLQGLCKKCELIILKSAPGEIGEPTAEAIDFLQNSLVTPAKAVIETGEVSEDIYNIYLALYHQFLSMPRASINDALKEDVYYYIRNAYFTEYYAANNNNVVTPLTKGTSDKYLWSIKKNSDGTVYIYSKSNGKAAYIKNDVADQKVLIGNEYAWTLTEGTTDIGDKGIFIVGNNGVTSWYTNPSTWNYVLTKPFWGACIWTFEESGIDVETSIEEIVPEENNTTLLYDLQGRSIEHPTRGIYITGSGKKIFIK